MIILIAGDTHTGKTILAQKLLEKYKYPYLSIDHLKMGLIRSGQCKLSADSNDMELTNYLWPIVREIIKTCIENSQNMIIEGCYIPFDWKKDFSREYLKYIKYYFYCALFVSLLVFFLPTFIFIRKKVKYINILKEEVLNMSQGDLNHPMTIKSHDELSILAREVDILRTTLDSNYQNESKIKEAHQELITSLSHDLRTPLTTLRGYLDILSLHCYKDEKQMDHYLKGCIEKTEQIKDLSNKTFEYALVFEQDLLPQLETIQSEQFIYYLQENLEYLELEGFRIEKEIDICSVDLQLDLSMMKRMINNICSNILKYAKKDKPIYLEISIKQGKIKIVFENEKKKDLQKIESNKIGLKSVQKIIETHHGQLFIQDLPETFVLIITLPYN